jgi:hypothetical protein
MRENIMKKKIVFILLTVALMIISVTAVASAASDLDSNEVFWWWGDPAGSSKIVRTDSGISGNVSTSLANDVASAKGLAVTLWIVVFNDPSECATSPCTDVDLGNPAVMPDVIYGAGNVVGNSEKIALGYHRNAGDNSGSIADLFSLPTNNGEPWGLIDPREAEIHYVVRSHGPMVPANMPEQINSFEGGCVIDYGPPGGPEDLHLDEGECQDIQFAINQP